jgi:hypothetical protein
MVKTFVSLLSGHASYFEEEEEEQQQKKNLHRSKTTGWNKWRITNLGTASRKEHKYSSFVGPTKGVKKSEAPHIHKDSLPLSVLLFFTEIFHLLVEQTYVCY